MQVDVVQAIAPFPEGSRSVIRICQSETKAGTVADELSELSTTSQELVLFGVLNDVFPAETLSRRMRSTMSIAKILA